MSDSPGTHIPAGWFHDPGGSGQLRWWDGTAWTAHLAPVPTPAPSAPPVVAPTPIIAPSFTPTFTPIVEPQQSAPGLDEPKYVPFQNPWTTRGYVNDTQMMARPARWNTVGGWFLATSYLWGVAVIATPYIVQLAVIGPATLTTGTGLSFNGALLVLSSYVIAWLLMVLAAARDRAALKRLGFLNPPSVLWILLVPPLIYLILRTVRVRKEANHGQAPLVFYLCSYVGVILLAVLTAVAIPLVIAHYESEHPGSATNSASEANARELASELTTGLDENGRTYSVTCTPFAVPQSGQIQVGCNAVDQSSQTLHVIVVQITAGVDGGKPTDRLVSVDPPIAND